MLKMREGDRRGEGKGERDEGREIPRDTKINLCVNRFNSTGKHQNLASTSSNRYGWTILRTYKEWRALNPHVRRAPMTSNSVNTQEQGVVANAKVLLCST